jgi:hypothetical protein
MFMALRSPKIQPKHGTVTRSKSLLYIANPEETTFECLNNLLMMMIELILLESVGALQVILSTNILR